MIERPKTYEEALNQQLKEIGDMLIVKHIAYGTDNLTRFGEYGILVRMSDKLSRLQNLLEMERSEMVNEALRSESIDETLKDLAGYAIQARLLRNGYLGLMIREKSDEHKD